MTGDYPPESDLNEVRFYRSTSSGFTPGSGNLLTTITSPTPDGTFTVTDDGSLQLSAPSNGSTYYYKAQADDDSGNTSTSNEASATPTSPLTDVSDLNAVPGDSQNDLDWTNPSGVNEVEVHRSTSSFTPTANDTSTLVTTISSPNDGGTETYLDDGSGQLAAPSNGTDYYYELVLNDGNAGSNEEISKPGTSLNELYYGEKNVSEFRRGKGRPFNTVWEASAPTGKAVMFAKGPNGGIYYGDGGSGVGELDTSDGSTVWSSGWTGNSLSQARLFGGHIYLYNGDNFEKWDLTGSKVADTGISPGRGTDWDGHSQNDIYIINGNGNVEKVDDTATSQWTWSIPNGSFMDLRADPTGGIWLVTHDGSTMYIYKVDSTGSLTNSLSYVAGSVGIRNGAITPSGDFIYNFFESNTDHIVRVDSAGTEVWLATPGIAIEGNKVEVAASDNNIYMESRFSNNLYELDLADGSLLNTYAASDIHETEGNNFSNWQGLTAV